VQKLDLQLVKRYKLPRKHGKIKKVYEMAKALVISEGISGGQNTTFGFAFNMEKVFEYYVRKLFQEFLPNCTEEPHEGRIWLCSEKIFLGTRSLPEPGIKYDLKISSSNSSPKKVKLIPDIVYLEENSEDIQTIVDCKWKFWNWNKTIGTQSEKTSKRRAKRREDIESKDIRQLFIYQMAYRERIGSERNSRLFLIYPSLEKDDNPAYLSRFVVGRDIIFPLWAFSFSVFKFNDKIGSVTDDNEEEQYWLEIEAKLDAIALFQKKNSPKK
jgi:5-methylcytosine-specific restriction endonuclease McrBC regulatory subunit McrC